MAKNENRKIVKTNGPIWSILIGTALVTLYFNSKIQDPFNSPKMWILLILGAWLSGYVITKKQFFYQSKKHLHVLLISLFFFGSLFLTLLATDIKYVALFGENQRRNGFLTYLALLILFLSAAIYFKVLD